MLAKPQHVGIVSVTMFDISIHSLILFLPIFYLVNHVTSWAVPRCGTTVFNIVILQPTEGTKFVTDIRLYYYSMRNVYVAQHLICIL